MGRSVAGAETILLVEDQAELRRAAQRVLETYGYHVIAAADGEQALRVYRECSDRVDLVLTDMVMPRLGGKDLYDAPRRDGAAVPFLFASGYASLEAREAGGLPKGCRSSRSRGPSPSWCGECARSSIRLVPGLPSRSPSPSGASHPILSPDFGKRDSPRMLPSAPQALRGNFRV